MNTLLFISLFSICLAQNTNAFWGNTPWNQLPADSGIKKICTEKLSEEESSEQKERANLCESLKNFVLGKKAITEQTDGLPDFSEEIKSNINPFMKKFFIDQQINAYINAIALRSVMSVSDSEKQKAFVFLLTSDRLHIDKEILTKEYYKNN
jgi:hypothetical protein